MAQQDDSVGVVLEKLRELHQEENTLIFYLSDNGGTRRGTGERKHTTGSLNTPLSGDKGTALEGGIRVPFLVQWRGTLPGGRTYACPVSSLDVLPTALAAAGTLPSNTSDGVNLLPFLKNERSDDPHDSLFWHWRSEQAVGQGDWKLVRGKADRDWRLIDLSRDIRETTDLTSLNLEQARKLRETFERWNATLPPVGPSFKDAIENEEPATDNTPPRP